MTNDLGIENLDKKMAERRRHSRLPVSVNQTYTANVDIIIKSSKFNFIIGNISISGLGIIVPTDFSKFTHNQEVLLVVHLFAERCFKVKAIIKHVSSAASRCPFMGIEFLNVTDENIRLIHQYFKSLSLF
ncbi:MAG: PilZ domain-containing protein [Bacteriovoracaceae bacterium]|nr:PilZ domain-containing protein [Bacteriovoracaceae bacterium]